MYRIDYLSKIYLYNTTIRNKIAFMQRDELSLINEIAKNINTKTEISIERIKLKNNR